MALCDGTESAVSSAPTRHRSVVGETFMPTYFEFEVSLRHVKPRIWRRFLIREGALFHELHEAIQDACGWESCHLYAFRDPNTRNTVATIPGDDGFGKPEPDAERVRVRTCFVPTTKTGCLYEYDFGDSWLNRSRRHESGVRPLSEQPATCRVRGDSRRVGKSVA
jgi:pRiA4b ORF-3-like protein